MNRPASGGNRRPRAAPYPLPLPEGARAAFGALDRGYPQNPGLIFDRYVPDWYGQPVLKKQGLQMVVEAARKADARLLEAWNRRWEGIVKDARGLIFFLKTAWRLVAGLGRKGPLEAGFTFHRYGFPVLPGSAIKGVARAWALTEIARKLPSYDLRDLARLLSADGKPDSAARKAFEEWYSQQSDDVRQLAMAFRAIFGTTAAAGRTVFFDAIPARLPVLEIDVMNPHYPQYYGGSEAPAGWQSPTPVYFLTVRAQTEFRFAVGWRRGMAEPSAQLLGQAAEWVRAGLTEIGAGAKTAAGYGYFESI